MFFGKKLESVIPDILLEDGDTLNLGSSEIKFILTPGHSSGSGCYIVDEKIFTGDTLFRLSIGRTDLPTGSYREMVKSLKRLLLKDLNLSIELFKFFSSLINSFFSFEMIELKIFELL